MTQVNTASKVARPIRRREVSKPTSDVEEDQRPHVWEAWINDKWVLYEASVQRILDRAHVSSSPVSFSLRTNPGCTYTVDWTMMTQVNTASKVARPVRRRKLDSLHTRWRDYDEELDATYGAVKFRLKNRDQNAIETFGISDEYHFRFAISQVFFRNENARFKVRSVDLILNPLVESRYNSMKEQFSREGKDVSVELVFHGTIESAAAQIAKEGFKVGGVDVNVRTGAVHGVGIHTDSKPDDPFKYATPKGGGTKGHNHSGPRNQR
jgi:hypothetical protein